MAAPTKHSETALCVVCNILWLRENSCLGRINLIGSHSRLLAVTLETVATGVKDLRQENVYYNQQSEQKCYHCGCDGHCPVECRHRGAIY
uniref:Uncharacterized protein n=1 Tax=Amphimedon queenslandica TaxID=400682 RepID=A0A1X7T3H2_AMPQE